MTGEVTDRFNEITLFGMVYFGKKQLNSLQNCYKINYSFSHRVERSFDPEFYCLYVSQISFSLGGIWIVGSQVDAQLN